MIAFGPASGDRTRLAATLGGVLVVTLAVIALTRPAAEVPLLETVTPGAFEVSVSGHGDLVPAQRHMVAPPFTAKIDSLVEEGSEVKAGQVVGKLNTDDIQESLQEEELHQSGLLKDEEARALTAERDRKSLLTDRQTALDDLALKRLLYQQQAAGIPAADRAALELKARAAARAYSTARTSFKLQAGLLAKGIIRPIDLDAAKVAFQETQRDRDVSATALTIARRGYPPEQVEIARLGWERARNTLREVEGKVKSLALTSAMQGRVTAAERAWSASRVALFQRRLASAAMHAPTAGVVVLNVMHQNGGRKKLQVGDEAREGQDIMEIADVRQVFIKTEIKEVDIGRVHVGMPAEIRVASLSKDFAGTLTHLGVLAYDKPDALNPEGAPRVFEGLIAINEHSQAFHPGMTVDTRLIVDEQPHALTVPNTALAALDGSTSVWVYHRGQPPERRVVKAGEQTETRTAITDGLAAGEQILVAGAP